MPLHMEEENVWNIIRGEKLSRLCRIGAVPSEGLSVSGLIWRVAAASILRLCESRIRRVVISSSGELDERSR